MLERLTRSVRATLTADTTDSGSGRTAGELPHVVIVGAGFAGLEAAKALRGEAVRVTLVDRNNYHKFQPLLYQVATAGLEPGSVAHSVRDIFRGAANVDFKLGTVSGIDAARRRVTTRSGLAISYDYLVVAAGAVTSYFGVEGAREHSFPLKNLSDAIALRNRILRQFERADRRREEPADATAGRTAGDAEAQQGALRFVVVGGGPTGVETAGALTELFRVMQRDYKRFDTTAAEVLLIEMTDQLLPAYASQQGAYTRDVLEKRGVQVLTEATVEQMEKGAVHLERGRRIATETLVWAAGVAASPVAGLLVGLLDGAEQGAGGRLPVQPDLRIAGRERIFVVGDASAGEDDEGRLYAQLAPVAMQQGEHAAKQILRLEKAAVTEAFAYRNLGKMATIGRNAAVAELPGGVRLEGFVAWLAWVFIHIAKLVGFRNRLNAFTGWIYNYLTYDRSARLILNVVPISERIPREVEEVDAEMQRAMRAMESPADE
jgi:NADH dehydrogenase